VTGTCTSLIALGRRCRLCRQRRRTQFPTSFLACFATWFLAGLLAAARRFLTCPSRECPDSSMTGELYQNIRD
jgi:hypothetical protein